MSNIKDINLDNPKEIIEKIRKYLFDEHFHLEKSNFKKDREPMEMKDNDMSVVDSIELEKFILTLIK